MKTFACLAGWSRWLSLGLRLYLCLFIVGCGAHRPPVAEIRNMQTRVLLGDERSVFDACVASLQDMGFSVETSDFHGGVLTASRTSLDPSNPTPQATGEKKKGMPTWAKVALVATGVILVVGAVAMITHDHDSDDPPKQAAARDSVRYRDAPRAEKKTRKHHHGGSGALTALNVDFAAPSPPTVYEYRITIQLRAEQENSTAVRVSLESAEYQGPETIRSGPVDDPDFFAGFFAALDESLRLEQEANGH